MSKLQQHPLSAAFPAITESELGALARDIEDNGLHDPIVLFENQVLDGWHRYKACGMAGKTPVQISFNGKDPVSFVLSKNLHRRHLSGSQRAIAIAACNDWRPVGRPQINSAVAAEYPSKSSKELAKDAGVGSRTIEHAKAAYCAGPEISGAVRDGKITAERGAQIAKLPKDERSAAIEAPKNKKTNGHAEPVVSDDLVTAREKIAHLESENADLQQINDRLSALTDGESETAAFIKDLQKQLTASRRHADSIKIQSQNYQNENAQLKSEVKKLQRLLDIRQRPKANGAEAHP